MASGRHRRARSVILPADTRGVFPRTVKRTIGMTPKQSGRLIAIVADVFQLPEMS